MDDGLDRLIAAEQDERRRIALFLHDGPVQNLSGIALMLDAAVHAIADRQARGRARHARDRARPAASDDQGAARSLVRPRAGRAARPGLRAGPAGARRPDRDRVPLRIDLEIDEAERARRDRAGRALHDHPRAARPGGAPRAAHADRRQDAGSRRRRRRRSSSDDAEPERRRRSFEAIEERVTQLHGTIEVDVARASGTTVTVDAAARTWPGARLRRRWRRRRLPAFVWSPAGYTLRELEGEPAAGSGTAVEDGRHAAS